MLPGSVTEKIYERETQTVPEIVVSTLSQFQKPPFGHYLDFGCDLGLKTLGYVISGAFDQVTGVDIQDNFRNLPEVLQRLCKLDGTVPANLDFYRAGSDDSPAAAQSLDGIISWSVMEHVRTDLMPDILADLFERVRPGGHSFVQVNPLFYSPQGAHLWGLLEPWEHLQDIAKVHELIDARAPHERKANAAKELFNTLNRFRLQDFIDAFEAVGFEIGNKTLGYSKMTPPPELLDRFAKEDLLTEGFQLVLRKPS